MSGRDFLGVVTHVLGELVGFSGSTPLVLLPGDGLRPASPARTIASLSPRDVGRQVLLALVDSDGVVPVIMGCLHNDTDMATATRAVVSSDSQELVLTAQERLVLQCGKSKLTLARDGTIKIEGVTLLSEASGSNRIRGGAIELN